MGCKQVLQVGGGYFLSWPIKINQKVFLLLCIASSLIPIHGHTTDDVFICGPNGDFRLDSIKNPPKFDPNNPSTFKITYDLDHYQSKSNFGMDITFDLNDPSNNHLYLYDIYVLDGGPIAKDVHINRVIAAMEDFKSRYRIATNGGEISNEQLRLAKITHAGVQNSLTRAAIETELGSNKAFKPKNWDLTNDEKPIFKQKQPDKITDKNAIEHYKKVRSDYVGRFGPLKDDSSREIFLSKYILHTPRTNGNSSMRFVADLKKFSFYGESYSVKSVDYDDTDLVFYLQ